MLPLQLYTSSQHLTSLSPSNEITYAALSQPPETAKVSPHDLIDEGCFGFPFSLPIWSK